MTDRLLQVQNGIARLSTWIDSGHGLGKIGEEHGKLVEALIGTMGLSTGRHRTSDDVDTEILDVIVTGFCALEHRHGNRGVVADMLATHVEGLLSRVGLSQGGGPVVRVGDRIRVLEWDWRDSSASTSPPPPLISEILRIGTKTYVGQPSVYTERNGRVGSCYVSWWELA